MRTRTVLAVLALTSGVALTGCGSDDSGTTAQDPVTSTTTGGTPLSGSTTPTVPATSSSAPTDAGVVPVYFVGDTDNGPRLFREFRDVGDEDPLTAAAALLVSGHALDPDYRTLLPDTLDITSIKVSDGAILLRVSADSPTSPDKSISPDAARLAVQQLVYTLQGVTQTRDPIKVVQGDGDQAAPTTLYGQDTVSGVDAESQLGVLGLVNVTTPEQGATVSGSFTASGVASSFEANVPWEIRKGDAEGAVVDQGSAMASGYLDKLYPWSVDIDVSDLTPGDYTFVARTDDPSGTEGPKATVDTKAITVK